LLCLWKERRYSAFIYFASCINHQQYPAFQLDFSHVSSARAHPRGFAKVESSSGQRIVQISFCRNSSCVACQREEREQIARFSLNAHASLGHGVHGRSMVHRRCGAAALQAPISMMLAAAFWLCMLKACATQPAEQRNRACTSCCAPVAPNSVSVSSFSIARAQVGSPSLPIPR